MDPADFLVTFIPERSGSTSNFFELYRVKETISKRIHDQFINGAPFSDLKIFSIILPLIPQNGMLQMGNSASVRYVQLFSQRTDIAYYANRGVSGIDGCTSTACGAAFDYEGYTTLITGDISFLYDSNGLWHDYVHPDLRIIVVNNQGGGIFRFIDGPSQTKQLDKYFEAHHHFTARGNAEKFDLLYESCDNEQDLMRILETFYEPAAKAKILEIFTPRELNDLVLKDYFRTIRNQKI
jgi:2-succinyl-5-enolpyruvyl-6-hydroxy-3-cyclohexene-1-carboxylate synthase